MKNAKRDITLNEKDTFRDMLAVEESLMREYCTAITKATRKETRSELVKNLCLITEEVFLLSDIFTENC